MVGLVVVVVVDDDDDDDDDDVDVVVAVVAVVVVVCGVLAPGQPHKLRDGVGVVVVLLILFFCS